MDRKTRQNMAKKLEELEERRDALSVSQYEERSRLNGEIRILKRILSSRPVLVVAFES